MAEKLEEELDQLSDQEIEARLAAAIWVDDKRAAVLRYLEEKKSVGCCGLREGGEPSGKPRNHHRKRGGGGGYCICSHRRCRLLPEPLSAANASFECPLATASSAVA